MTQYRIAAFPHLTVPLLLLALLAALALPAVAQPGAAGKEIELRSFNGIYTGLDDRLQPIEQGPITVHLQAPEHELRVLRNRLVLRPVAGGAYDAEIEVEVAGQGFLVADVESMGVTSRFEDVVRLPQQLIRLRGIVHLARVKGGFEVTPVEIPETVGLRIESQALDGIVSTCELLSQLVSLGCGALGNALSTVQIPLDAGDTFRLESARLSEAERGFFAAAAAQGSPPPATRPQ